MRYKYKLTTKILRKKSLKYRKQIHKQEHTV